MAKTEKKVSEIRETTTFGGAQKPAKPATGTEFRETTQLVKK